MTVAEVRDEFGVSADWVYANADGLGAIRLGSGPAGATPLRPRDDLIGSPAWRPGPRRRARPDAGSAEPPEDGELLPIRGQPGVVVARSCLHGTCPRPKGAERRWQPRAAVAGHQTPRDRAGPHVQRKDGLRPGTCACGRTARGIASTSAPSSTAGPTLAPASSFTMCSPRSRPASGSRRRPVPRAEGPDLPRVRLELAETSEAVVQGADVRALPLPADASSAAAIRSAAAVADRLLRDRPLCRGEAARERGSARGNAPRRDAARRERSTEAPAVELHHQRDARAAERDPRRGRSAQAPGKQPSSGEGPAAQGAALARQCARGRRARGPARGCASSTRRSRPKLLERGVAARACATEGWSGKRSRADLDVAESTAIYYAQQEARPGLSPRRTIIACLAGSGLRNTELCQIDIRDVDFAHRHINVEDAKTEPASARSISARCCSTICSPGARR